MILFGQSENEFKLVKMRTKAFIYQTYNNGSNWSERELEFQWLKREGVPIDQRKKMFSLAKNRIRVLIGQKENMILLWLKRE